MPLFSIPRSVAGAGSRRPRRAEQIRFVDAHPEHPRPSGHQSQVEERARDDPVALPQRGAQDLRAPAQLDPAADLRDEVRVAVPAGAPLALARRQPVRRPGSGAEQPLRVHIPHAEIDGHPRLNQLLRRREPHIRFAVSDGAESVPANRPPQTDAIRAEIVQENAPNVHRLREKRQPDARTCVRCVENVQRPNELHANYGRRQINCNRCRQFDIFHGRRTKFGRNKCANQSKRRQHANSFQCSESVSNWCQWLSGQWIGCGQ